MAPPVIFSFVIASRHGIPVRIIEYGMEVRDI